MGTLISEADFNTCATLVERGDPARFRAVMALPPADREKLFPLYAFNVEVSRAPWVTQESMIAEMRLQWWRDTLEEIANNGHVRRHEIVTPLAQILTPDQAQQLDILVEARRWDIYKDPFEGAVDFERYLTLTSGILLHVAAQLLGRGEGALAENLGYVQGLANWFKGIPQLEAQGRIPLVDGRNEVVAGLAREALNRLRSARANRQGVDKRAGRAFLVLTEAEGILRQVAADPSCVVEGRLHPSGFWSRMAFTRRVLTGRW